MNQEERPWLNVDSVGELTILHSKEFQILTAAKVERLKSCFSDRSRIRLGRPILCYQSQLVSG